MGVFFVFYTLTLKESLSLQEGETEERSSLTRQILIIIPLLPSGGAEPGNGHFNTLF